MTLLKDIPGVETQLLRARIRTLWAFRHTGRKSEIRTVVQAIRKAEA